jgi:hypothetical protein
VTEQQTLSQQAVAAMNNTNAKVVQQMQNDAALANIKANGVINTEIQNLTNSNKLLLQTSAGASQLYNQALTSLSSILTSPNLSTDQQATALNDAMATLRDGLSVMNGIAGNQSVASTLVFGNGAAAAASGGTAAASGAAADTPAGGPILGYFFGAPYNAAGQVIDAIASGGSTPTTTAPVPVPGTPAGSGIINQTSNPSEAPFGGWIDPATAPQGGGGG